MNSLQDVLAEFSGLTSDQIAQLIKRRKIKGRSGTTYHCPMAIALHNAQGGTFIIGRRYIARQSHGDIEKIPTPKNIATFVRKFDIGDYPELMAPAPRCLAPRPKQTSHGPGWKMNSRTTHKRKVRNQIAKMVDRFGRGDVKAVTK